jgi:hypothetical protein
MENRSAVSCFVHTSGTDIKKIKKIMLVIEYFSWFMYMYPDVVIGNFL